MEAWTLTTSCRIGAKVHGFAPWASAPSWAANTRVAHAVCEADSLKARHRGPAAVISSASVAGPSLLRRGEGCLRAKAVTMGGAGVVTPFPGQSERLDWRGPECYNSSL